MFTTRDGGRSAYTPGTLPIPR